MAVQKSSSVSRSTPSRSVSAPSSTKSTSRNKNRSTSQANTYTRRQTTKAPDTQTGQPARTGVRRAARTATAAQTQKTHNVVSGDTLSKIAQQHGTTWQELARYNNLSNPDLIHPDQQIHIPPSEGAPALAAPTAPAVAAPAAPTAPATATPATAAPATVAPTTAPGATTGGVTTQQLREIMPNVSQARAERMLPHLNHAMAEANIDTPQRQAAFLAQLAHESGEFRYMEEIASGAAYEGRSDLGNTQRGDGRRFKGRGPIQLTGRFNYTKAGRELGLDLVGNPEQVATPEVGFRTSAWYWNDRGLNRFADNGNFRELTRRINGGYNGLADRTRYYQRALNVLGG